MNRKLLVIAVILSLVSITTIAVTAEENVFSALNSAIDSAVDAVNSLTYARQPKSADKVEPQRDDVATPADTETSIDTKTTVAEINTRLIKGIWGLGTSPEVKGEFHGSCSSHLVAGELIDEYGNIIANAKFEVQPATHLTQTVHVFSGQITYADKCGNTYATSITGKFGMSGRNIVAFWSTVSPTTARSLTQDSCKAYIEGWFFGEVA